MLKLLKLHANNIKSVAASLCLLLCSFSLMAEITVQGYQRVIATPSPTDVPQYTIQIDTYNTLAQAVEFGYELPFSENALGLARYRENDSYRYVLALGTFYSRTEAEEVLQGMCSPAGLNRCQVRYLAELEGIYGSETVVNNEPALQAEPEPIDVVVPEVQPQLVSSAPVSRQLFDVSLNDALVYTIQIAAMYTIDDALRVTALIPSRFGIPEVIAEYSAKGNVVQTIVLGRFAYKDIAKPFADDVCLAIGLSDCWVKPLALVKPIDGSELSTFSTDFDGNSDAVTDVLHEELDVLDLSRLEAEPQQTSGFERLVYTVQLAAMYEYEDAVALVDRVPASFGKPEIIPVYASNGDIVQSVTVGRFAYKDEGSLVASDVCSAVGLTGCWVKPLVTIEETRAPE